MVALDGVAVGQLGIAVLRRGHDRALALDGDGPSIGPRFSIRSRTVSGPSTVIASPLTRRHLITSSASEPGRVGAASATAA